MSDTKIIWAKIKEIFYELDRICPLDNVSDEFPSGSSRTVYAELISNIFSLYLNFITITKASTLQLQITENIGTSHNEFRTNIFLPNLSKLASAYQLVDETSYGLMEFCHPELLKSSADSTRLNQIHVSKKSKPIKAYLSEIIDTSLQQEGSILNSFRFKKKIQDIISEPIFNFNPDEWTERAELLSPIIIGFSNNQYKFPEHIQIRLIEVFQTFIQGHSISVIVLCRSILEASLWDRQTALHIVTINETRNRDLPLDQLIEQASKKLPEIEGAMDLIRREGNAYVHPKKEKIPRIDRISNHNNLKNAQTSIVNLLSCLELIYAYKS